MPAIAVVILLPPARLDAPPAVRWLDRAREAIAARTAALFGELAGPEHVTVARDVPGASFGERLRGVAAQAVAAGGGRRVGLVVAGGGAMPLAGPDELAPFVATALARRARVARANSFYSADVVAVSDARILLDTPDLPSDNALPRWLAERAGVPVADLRDRARAQQDVDSPLDVLLLARDPGCPPELRGLADEIAAARPRVAAAIEGVRAVLADRRAELVIAGRTSARTLEWLERRTACRVRALVEERGLRAASPLALGLADHADPAGPDAAEPAPDAVPTDEAAPSAAHATARPRPPRSVLGLLLDDRGPSALGAVLAELGDAAIVDSRVLLAHRLGADEAGWPPVADRLASDLLAPGDIDDPWLRALTDAAASAPIPVLLGGHSLVGPGVALLGHPLPHPGR